MCFLAVSGLNLRMQVLHYTKSEEASRFYFSTAASSLLSSAPEAYLITALNASDCAFHLGLPDYY